MRKHWRVLVLAAAFLLAGLWAAYGQNFTFESHKHTIEVDGDKQTVEKKSSLFTYEGFVRWDKGEYGHTNLLMTGEKDESEGEGWQSINYGVIDKGGMNYVMSIAYVEDSDEIRLGLFGENLTIILYGEFIPKDEPKKTKTWDGSSSI